MPRSRGRKTDYEWSGATWGVSQSAGGSTITGIAVFVTSGTIFRIRGNGVASIDGETDGDKMVLGLGLMVISNEAFAAGVASAPSPIGDPNAAWLWHQYVPLQSQAANNEHQAVGRFEIDSKAMRKFKPNSTLALMWTGGTLLGSPAFDVTGGIRVLIGS